MMYDPQLLHARPTESGSGQARDMADARTTADTYAVAKGGMIARRLATIAQWTIRVTGPLLVMLGILFWTGRAFSLLPLHMSLGLIFVIALIVLGAIAVRARVHRAEAALALALALIIPILGMMQARLLPGSWHWLVRVVHLLIGVAGMVVAARLVRAIRGIRSQRRVVSS